MAKMLRMACAFLLLLAGVSAAAAEPKPFAREDLASDVVRLTETLRKDTARIGAKFKGRSAEQLLKEAATAATAANYKGAAELIGAAVSAAPKDFAPWLALAKLGQAADDAKADGRYEIVARATTAAYAAYEYSKATAGQAE